MKITLAMVMTADGRTTKHGDPRIYAWTSNEDQKHFFSLVESSPLIIMGSKTYEAARGMIKHKPGRLRIVMTRNPKGHTAIPGQLECTDESPHVLIPRLESMGYREALLVGGSTINAVYLKAGLVNELLLTVEPYLFGSGTPLVADTELSVNLTVKSVDKLNERGTLLLRYTL